MAGPATKPIPIFSSLQHYSPAWLRGDVMAGLTVWAVLVPESLAYATIAGVPPVVGLYAAFPALVLYAAFGSSRHLVVGPMSGTAALSAGIIGTFVAAGSDKYVALTAALAIVTGVIALIAGLARLGFLANFISEPVLKGVIVGLALTIIVGQLPALFGVEKGEGDFFEKLWDLVRNLGDTSVTTLAVGACSLALVLVCKLRFPKVPGSLLVVLLGVLAVHLLDLDQHGVAIVGHIQSGLPSFGLPGHLASQDYLDLAGPAAGLMLIGFAEGLGAAKTYATRDGYEIDTNQELVGLGVANLGAGFSSGMVVNGSLSKTAVNGGAGAKTQMSGLVVAALTILTLLFLTGVFEDLPEATLAAVVIAAVIELVDVDALLRLYRVWTHRLGSIYGPAARADFLAAIAAMFGVLIFDTLPGLVIGIATSLVLLLYRVSRPNIATLGRIGGDRPAWVDVARQPDANQVPGVAVVRVEAGLFFANAEFVRDALRSVAEPAGVRALVVDAQTMPYVDVSAARVLIELDESLRRDGVMLFLARDVGQVRDVLRRTGRPDEQLAHVYRSVDAAVDAARAAIPPPDDAA